MSDSSARWRYGLYAVVAGFIAVILCVAIVAIRYGTPRDAITVAAPAIAAIGALAGAYFGVQAGSAGKEESDAARDKAQRLALKFAAVADPDAALYVLGLPPQPAGPDGGGGRQEEAGQSHSDSAPPPEPVDLTTTDLSTTDLSTDGETGQAVTTPPARPATKQAPAGAYLPDNV